ncbi:hypothetical protein Dimus_007639 [Dionaea muscipula]
MDQQLAAAIEEASASQRAAQKHSSGNYKAQQQQPTRPCSHQQRPNKPKKPAALSRTAAEITGAANQFNAAFSAASKARQRQFEPHGRVDTPRP